MSRRVTIQTPLGEQLQLRQLQGREALSELFDLQIDLLSPSENIDPKALLGKSATVVIETQDGGKRYIDGIVTRFGMQGQDHKEYSYRLRLSPWLWLATRKSDFRIFQNLTVPDIIEQVLGKYGYGMQRKLTRGYRTWDYCVQYNESDHQFVSRLMEHEGIYYYHQHGAGQHVLTFADDINASHQSLPGAASIPFHPPEKAAVADRECIHAWELHEQVLPGQYHNDDYDFEKPRADLSNTRQTPPGHAHDSYETYEWPGGYTSPADGATYARQRIEQNLTLQRSVRGQSNHRALTPGYTFALENYPRGDQNQQYLITEVQYHFEENPRVSDTGAGKGSIQRFTLHAQPTTLAYKPARTTEKPRTTGPQTAVVVGPAGEEIWTDQYGRVKVQFHWDRVGSMDENSSCWIRVSHPWAGSNYGAIFTPRIGQEVIVDFLNGDPDYPIITGRVYNAMQMPPWDLPANATQSGILTRSSKDGAPGAGLKNGPGDANALRFEDKAGEEQLWLHAQKDQLTEVENDEDKWVGRDRRKTIDRDEFNTIHRDRTEVVDRNEKINVHGWRTEEVDLDETITIHQNRTERVDLNESVDIGIDRHKTIGKTETDKIGQNWHINVGMLKTQTVGMAYMQNVGVGKMTNVGVVCNLNVGMQMITNVGMNQSLTVGKDRKVSVGANQKTDVGEDRQTTIGKNDTLVVGEEILMHAKKIQLQADQEIILTCGASTIKITKADIQILSPLDRLNC